MNLVKARPEEVDDLSVGETDPSNQNRFVIGQCVHCKKLLHLHHAFLSYQNVPFKACHAAQSRVVQCQLKRRICKPTQYIAIEIILAPLSF